MLHHMHEAVIGGGHLGRNKTKSKLAVHYYWDTMDADTKEWIKGCQRCAIVKNLIPTPKPPWKAFRWGTHLTALLWTFLVDFLHDTLATKMYSFLRTIVQSGLKPSPQWIKLPQLLQSSLLTILFVAMDLHTCYCLTEGPASLVI